MDEEFLGEGIEEDYDVYAEGAREELAENDEIEEGEEGFMRGYESDADMAYCDNCKQILGRSHIEKEFDGEVYTFCSEECAEQFERKRKA